MIGIAKALTDDEMKAAAKYFSSMPWSKWIRVVEAKEVPKSRIAGSMHTPTNDGTEPLGQRIIEMPEDLPRTELRDAASGFVAYVPPGSIAKGEKLVKTGGSGKTVACGTCHGQMMQGQTLPGPLGIVAPRLAGQHPIYLARELYLFKDMSRAGKSAAFTHLHHLLGLGRCHRERRPTCFSPAPLSCDLRDPVTADRELTSPLR